MFRKFAWAATLLGAICFGEPLMSPNGLSGYVRDPFVMLVLDADTGRPVPHLRMTTDNGIVCFTRPDGAVNWTEGSLMNRGVHFAVRDDQQQFANTDATVHVTRGGVATLTVRRRTDLSFVPSIATQPSPQCLQEPGRFWSSHEDWREHHHTQ